MINYHIRHTLYTIKNSPWPFFFSISFFFSIVFFLNYICPVKFLVLTLPVNVFFFINFINLICIVVWRLYDLITESTYMGLFTDLVQKNIRTGFKLFIISEFILFFAFFWTLFYFIINPSFEIGLTWPPFGIQTLNPWTIPVLNTIILLVSGLCLNMTKVIISMSFSKLVFESTIYSWFTEIRQKLLVWSFYKVCLSGVWIKSDVNKDELKVQYLTTIKPVSMDFQNFYFNTCFWQFVTYRSLMVDLVHCDLTRNYREDAVIFCYFKFCYVTMFFKILKLFYMYVFIGLFKHGVFVWRFFITKTWFLLSLVGFTCTISLGILFTGLQLYEYILTTFDITDSIYGSIFFMLTGLHGLHVLGGTCFLIVCIIRHRLGHFTQSNQLSFDCAVWYWHFVDIVWIGVFFSLYVYGS